MPLFLCFIGLQKEYDFVDRTLLWQVLSRFGVRPNIIEVIQHFHDGLRTGVRNNDGRRPAWFKAVHVLRQGCVLPPLLFNVFFTAILLVALGRFIKGADILADLPQVEEQPS